jgi:hypothetical protein
VKYVQNGRIIQLIVNKTTEEKIGGFPLFGSLELLKFQLFYRQKILNQIFIEVGSFASVSYDEGDWLNPFNTGIEISANYLIRKISIGTRIQGGWNFNPFSDDK